MQPVLSLPLEVLDGYGSESSLQRSLGPITVCKKSAAYLKRFVDEYDVEDSHVEVLIRVCESMDRADQAAAGRA